MKKTTLLVASLIVLVIIAIIVYFWYAKQATAPIPSGTVTSTPQGLGSQLYQQTGAPASSPLQGSNPFENVKTNPFQ